MVVVAAVEAHRGFEFLVNDRSHRHTAHSAVIAHSTTIGRVGMHHGFERAVESWAGVRAELTRTVGTWPES